MADIFDIDAQVGEFEPVRIRFRGEELVLGESVMDVMAACEAAGHMPEDQEGLEGVRAMLGMIRPALRVLNPKLRDMLDERDLSPAEEVALVRPVTVALSQFTKALKFPAEEGSGE